MRTRLKYVSNADPRFATTLEAAPLLFSHMVLRKAVGPSIMMVGHQGTQWLLSLVDRSSTLELDKYMYGIRKTSWISSLAMKLRRTDDEGRLLVARRAPNGQGARIPKAWSSRISLTTCIISGLELR